ncbi:MAG TPA: TIGR03790 family protein [Opitutales bacterium]|nr:TIGR03790 family protein [Opitutales bacterium]
MAWPRAVQSLLAAAALLALGVARAADTVADPADAPPEPPAADRVVVVANAREPDSERIARYYMAKRQIPEKNLVVVDMPTTFDVTWSDFVEKIFNPLRERLTRDGWLSAYATSQKDREGRLRYIFYGNKIDFLVVCYGVPVRILNDPSRLVETPLTLEHKELNNNQAAVDSELSLLAAPDVPTAGFVANPLFHTANPSRFARGQVVKVARLDGPGPVAVRALIDSALEGETTGLQGRAYVDLGGPHQEGEDWLKSAATTLRKLGFDLSEDHNRELFGWRERFDAPAIYLGWYLDHLTGPIADPNFHFPPGAIAVHIHSFSASVLRDPQHQWVGPLVTRGAAATLGNVFEPYLTFTHHLDLFMEALADGKTTGEAAYYSLPVLSWQGIFIGDPLYRPFAVGLPTQLELAKRGLTPEGVYAVIRQMNLLQEQGRIADAFALGQEQFAHQPDLALALELAQLGRTLGRDDSDALARLAKAAAVPATRDRLGLYADAARWAAAAGGRPLALDLLDQALTTAGADSEFAKAVLPEAVALAGDAGDTVRRDRWQKQLDALTPKK